MTFTSLEALLLFYQSSSFRHTNPTAALLSTLATFGAGFVVQAFWRNRIRKARRFGRPEVYLHGHADFNGWINVCNWSYTRFQHHWLLGSGVGRYHCAYFRALPSEVNMEVQRPTWLSMPRQPKRGFYTSFIQTTATLGLFVSIGVILGVRQSMGIAEFSEWGWRIPFLLSAFLVAVSVFIRLQDARVSFICKN